MIFHTLDFDPTTRLLRATAQGHATEVLSTFRELASIVYTNRGAWRIIDVQGHCPSRAEFESDMAWTLKAQQKLDHQQSTIQIINT